MRLITSSGTGSGAVIEVSGDAAYVVTNRHVVEDASGWLRAVVGDGDMFLGEVVGIDELYDLAAVRICCSDGFQALELVPPGTSVDGVKVAAFGYPIGSVTLRATWGQVGTVQDQPDEYGVDMSVEVDTFEGNSGGPLISPRGHVLGVNARSLLNQPVGEAVSGGAIRQQWPLLTQDYTPSRPDVKWPSNPFVSARGLLEVDVNILRKPFTPCGILTPEGTACRPNVRLYRSGNYYASVYGYECASSTAWCIGGGSERHLYYPSSGRLLVNVSTDLHEHPPGSRWHVCIFDNTEEETLFGCAPLEFKR